MSIGATPAQTPPHAAAARQRRSTRQLLLGRAWFILTGYAVAVILARTLDPADYGVYGVLVSVVTWLGMLASAGVPGATSRLLAQVRENTSSVEQAARTLLLGLGTLLFAIGWMAAPAIAGFFHLPGGSTVVRVAILDLPFIAVYATYQGVLGGHRRFGLLAGGQGIYGIVKLGGVLGLLGLGLTLERVLLVNALATAVVCGFLALRHPIARGRAEATMLRQLAWVAVPMGIYLIGGQILINLDLWAFKRLWQGDGDVVGHYVASLNVAKTVLIIPVVQSSVLLASVSWALAEHNKAAARHHIQEASRFALLLAVPACALLVSDASGLLGTLFSAPYAAGGRFLQLQLAGFALFGLVDAYAMCLMAAGRQWLAARVLLGIMPVVLLANATLIPRLGGTGAAASLVIGTTLAALVLGYLTYQRFGALVSRRTLGRVLLAGTIVAVLTTLISVSGPLLFVKLALLGGLYVVILALTGEISRADFGMPTAKMPASSAPPSEGDPPGGGPGPRS